jgi:hypothetical protein
MRTVGGRNPTWEAGRNLEIMWRLGYLALDHKTIR